MLIRLILYLDSHQFNNKWKIKKFNSKLNIFIKHHIKALTFRRNFKVSQIKM